MKYEISVMGIVFCNQKVLLLHNEEHEWVFPKGQLEGVENNIQAVCREIKEETGVSVRLDDYIGFVGEFGYHYMKNNTQLTRKKVFVYCFSIPEEQTINITEKIFIGCSWFSISDAEILLTHPDSKRMFQISLKMLNDFVDLEKNIALYLARVENTAKYKGSLSLCDSDIAIYSDSSDLLTCAKNECIQYRTVRDDDITYNSFELYVLSQPFPSAFTYIFEKFGYNKNAFLGKDYQKHHKIVNVHSLKLSFAIEDGYVLIESKGRKYLFLNNCVVDSGKQIMRVLREYIYTQKSNNEFTMLHAAGIRVGGNNILILGNKGNGKTTLLCKLLASQKADNFLANDKVWISICQRAIYAHSYPIAVRIGKGTIDSIEELRDHINEMTLHRGVNEKNEKFELTPKELSVIFHVDNVEKFVPEIIIITHFSDDNRAYLIENNYDKKEFIDEHILRYGSDDTVNGLYSLPLIHFYCKKECSPEEIYNSLEESIRNLL